MTINQGDSNEARAINSTPFYCEVLGHEGLVILFRSGKTLLRNSCGFTLNRLSRRHSYILRSETV